MIIESVTCFMAKEMVPISIAEKSGFLSIVKKLDVQYKRQGNILANYAANNICRNTYKSDKGIAGS